MIVKIDNSVVTLTGNPSLGRNVKKELDTGKINITSTRSFRYEMYAKVDITDPYLNVEQYLIQADNPIRLNATEYEHNLSLFENIAFLTTVFPADRSFKIIGQTLEDILLAYQRELNAYHNVSITWTTIPQAVLDEVIPYKEFSGLNLALILLSLFRKLWANPKVNRIGDDWDIYPQYISDKGTAISKDSISSMSQQNSVDYATKVKSQLKNSVNEQTETTWFPSENGYVLPRSSSLEKITSKLRYEVDSGIVAIDTVQIVGVDYSFLENDNVTLVQRTNQVIDLTAYTKQEQEWEYLPTISTPAPQTVVLTDNTRNAIRYKVGDMYITNLFEASTDKLIFTSDTPYLIQAVRRAIQVLINGEGYTNIPTVISPTATADFKLRIKYVKQRDMDIVHSRKTKGVMNESTTIHQQRDSSVEVNEYKKNLKLISNQMGNNTVSKTKIFTYPDEPYEVFDYSDNKFIVTNVLNTYHNKYVYCEYEESENFANIEAEYALMNTSDPYTINSKAVTTNLVIQESLEFSTQARSLDTRLLSDSRRLLLGLFETTTIGLDKISAGVFKPVMASWNSDYAIRMPVESSGDAGLITAHVQFPHQTIAGKTYYDLDTDTFEDYLNPLPYTEPNTGTLADFELYFTPDILFEDAGEYPIILDETLYLASALTAVGAQEPIDLDAAASLAVTYEINITADENIYIGNAFASENYFHKTQATTSAILIYTSSKPYGEYDQVPRVGDIDNTANISYTYSFANRTHTITPTSEIDYFSLVKDGNILLAMNRNIQAGETVIININHLSANVIVLSAEITNTVIASTSIEYINKFTQRVDIDLSAIATLETAHEIGKFNYSAVVELQALASLDVVTQLGSFNYSADIEHIANASMEVLTHQVLDYNAVIELSASASLDLVYGYFPNYDVAIEHTASASLDVITFADLPLVTLTPSITSLSYDGSFHFKVKNNDLDSAYLKWSYQTGSPNTNPQLGNVLRANNNETTLQSTGSYGGSTTVYFTATAHASDTGKLISELLSFSIRGIDL